MNGINSQESKLFDCCGYMNLFFPPISFIFLLITLLEAQELDLNRIGGGGGAKGAMAERIGQECRMYDAAHFYFQR